MLEKRGGFPVRDDAPDTSTLSGFLTRRTEVRCPLCLYDSPDRRPATQAGLAGAAVHARRVRIVPLGSVGAGKVPQGRSAGGDGLGEHLPHGIGKPDVSPPRYAPGRRCRVDPGLEQGFGRVDVPDPDDDAAGEQDRLDRAALVPGVLDQPVGVEARIERFDAQGGQQGVSGHVAPRGGMPEHDAEAPRIIQAGQRVGAFDFHVIVGAARRSRSRLVDPPRAGHAEVGQEHPVRKVPKQVFPPPPDPFDRLPQYGRGQCRRDRQPEAAMEDAQRTHAASREPPRQFPRCDFDLWQFRHGGS